MKSRNLRLKKSPKTTQIRPNNPQKIKIYDLSYQWEHRWAHLWLYRWQGLGWTILSLSGATNGSGITALHIDILSCVSVKWS